MIVNDNDNFNSELGIIGCDNVDKDNNYNSSNDIKYTKNDKIEKNDGYYVIYVDYIGNWQGIEAMQAMAQHKVMGFKY